jgi:hypothetical protein
MRFVGIIIEQGLIGVGNFLVSWMALRHLTSDQMALFALVWSIAWALFAVFSEALITPLRVQMASSGKSDSLDLIRLIATAIALLLVIVSLPLVFIRPLGESLSLGFMALGIPSAAIAFYSARSVDIETRRPKRMIRRGIVYASCSLAGLLLISEVFPSTGLYPVVACLALIVGSLDGGTKWNFALPSLGKAFRLVGHTAWANRAFGIATALRVTLFSSGLLFFIGLILGHQAVAVYAAFFVLISPIQLASSSLPWLLLSRQAKLITNRKKFLSEMLLQLSGYVFLGLIACGILTLVWDWWTTSSISDSLVRGSVSASLIGVLLLMLGILLTSWSSTLTQILKLRNVQLLAVILGGIAGFVVVFMSGNIIFAALAPYGVSFIVSSGFIFWKANSIGKTQHSSDVKALQ